MGEHAAWLLADKLGSIEKLSAATASELTEIDGIGPVMAESISGFFSSRENLKILKKISEAGLKMSSAAPKEKSARLAGKTIVITGTLKGFSRNDAETLVRRLGGNPSSSVSKATDYLVAGEEPGSKLDKARSLGIKIINEEEFKRLTES